MKDKRGRKRSVSSRNATSELIGEEIYIPADFFRITVPGMYYKFRVVKKDNVHKNAMTVMSLEQKGPKNWIPISLVKQWVNQNKEMGSKRQCTNEESDQYAADALLALKHHVAEGDVISDVESASNARVTGKKRRRTTSKAKRKTASVKHDLVKSKGFLKRTTAGRYSVRLEGDDSEEETSK